MKRLKMAIRLTTGLVLFLCYSLSTAETITLHSPTMIEDAAHLGQAIHRLSGKVMRCVVQHAGNARHCICKNTCSCRFKHDYVAVREAFDQALRHHPNWAGNIIVYRTPARHSEFSISFSKAMQRHFTRPCHDK